MATSPAFASVPVIWSGVTPATADTSFTAPSNVTTLGSAGANGTKITQIDVINAGTTVLGLVNVFLFDGTSYHLHESVLIAAYTSSTTAAPPKQPFYYDELVLPSGWSLRITTTLVGNASVVEVNAFGSSL